MIRSEVRFHFAASAALFAAACAAFFPCLFNSFVNWDDTVYLHTNPLIASLDASSLARLFSTAYQQAYTPLSFLTFALERPLFGLDPLPYHAVSIVIHALNAVLVYAVFFLLTRSRGSAFLGALLFAVHPVQTEAVAWVTQRATLLSAFFFLASVAAFLSGRRTKRALLSSFFLFIMSGLCKPQGAALPLVLLLIDRTREPRDRRLSAGWFMLFATAAFLVLAVSFMASSASTVQSGRLLGASVVERLPLVAYAPFFYLKQLCYPFALSALYGKVPAGQAPSALILSVLWAGAAALLFLVRSRTFVGFGVLLYLVILAPTLPVFAVRHTAYADRYLYPASIGLFYIVGEGLCRFIRSLGRKVRVIRVAGLSLVGALFLGLATISAAQCTVWRDSVALWSDVVIKGGDRDAFVWFNLGNAYRDAGDLNAAMACYDRALSLEPNDARALHNRGHLLFGAGHLEAALADLERSIRLEPGLAIAYSNRALILVRLKRLPEALDDIRRAAALEPGDTRYAGQLAAIQDLMQQQ